jgi:hypothetical protein
MSLRISGKQSIRRTSNLFTNGANYTALCFTKIAAPRTIDASYLGFLQWGTPNSAQWLYLNNTDGLTMYGADDWDAHTTPALATAAAGGPSGTNWFAWAMRGVAAGNNGLKVSHKPVGSGSLTHQSCFNTIGTSSAMNSIQFGDLSFTETSHIDGYLCHLKLWNVALSDAELLIEMNQAAPTQQSGQLISYHSFTGADATAALSPNAGTGSFVYFNSPATMSTDNPVFGSTAYPTLTGSDTLPGVRPSGSTGGGGGGGGTPVVEIPDLGELPPALSPARRNIHVLNALNRSSSGVGIGTSLSAITAALDINGDKLRIRTPRTVLSPTSPGNVGEQCWDSNYYYVCIATNTWRRIPLATW